MALALVRLLLATATRFCWTVAECGEPGAALAPALCMQRWCGTVLPAYPGVSSSSCVPDKGQLTQGAKCPWPLSERSSTTTYFKRCGPFSTLQCGRWCSARKAEFIQMSVFRHPGKGFWVSQFKTDKTDYIGLNFFFQLTDDEHVWPLSDCL